MGSLKTDVGGSRKIYFQRVTKYFRTYRTHSCIHNFLTIKFKGKKLLLQHLNLAFQVLTSTNKCYNKVYEKGVYEREKCK